MTIWQTALGTRGTREDFKALYGGSTNPGIVTPKDSPFLLLFSDADAAAYYGYGLDGWSADGSFFRYTGSGSLVDQVLTHGNKAIADSPNTRREIHLFIAVGNVGKTRTKIHEYVGQFAVDADDPYVIQNQPSAEGKMRKTFVFNLYPDGEILRVGHRQEIDDFAEELAGAQEVPLEVGSIATFDRSGTESGIAERREHSLVERFTSRLAAAGHEFSRYKVYPPGSKHPLFTDFVDSTDAVLYEAKADASRNSVRTALGQLLDYKRYLVKEISGLRVLLPSDPGQDLRTLLHAYAVDVVWEDLDGRFMLDSSEGRTVL